MGLSYREEPRVAGVERGQRVGDKVRKAVDGQ